VLDRIKVYHNGNDVIEGIFARNSDSIAQDVLAVEIVKGEGNGYTKEWSINGETVTLGVEKQ
jgi:isoleucyl-tRNA synthetase